MYLHSNTPSNADLTAQAIDCVTQAIKLVSSDLQSKLDKATARAEDEGFPVLRAIKSCNSFGGIYSPSNYLKPDNSCWSRERTPEELKTFYTKLLDDARATLEAQHADNLPAIASNKKLKEKLQALFLGLGFTTTVRVVDHKSRSRTTKYIDETCGWFSTVNGITTSDNYEYQLDVEKRLRADLVTYLAAMEKKVAEAKALEEKKKQEEKKNRTLGVILARYGLSSDTTAEDALDVILEKNKYLRLAHYLLKNRNDWNDGYHYAECGLRSFSCDTDEDRAIYEAIEEIINGDDCDGRYFRDNKYGYDFLFSKAAEYDSVLYKDYQTMSEMVPMV